MPGGRERDDAEVQQVEEAPSLHRTVEQGPGGERHDDEGEEPPELRVLPGAPDGADEADQYRDGRDYGGFPSPSGL
jgi:hypothetical protein